MIDVCGVLDLYGEDRAVHSSLVSMVRARAAAEALGMTMELLVVADCPTQTTGRYLATAEALGAKCVVVDVGDFGTRRNLAVETSRSTYVAFLDGGDICSQNWYFRAFEEAGRDLRDVVWHPEATFHFGGGGEPVWRLHPDMDLKADEWFRLAIGNPWTSQAFARRELFLQAPYGQSSRNEPFGNEDWAWNADIIGRGMIHKIVPGTVHLLRHGRKPPPANKAAAESLGSPTHLFLSRLGPGRQRTVQLALTEGQAS